MAKAYRYLIIYTVGDSVVAPLKEQYVKYGKFTSKAMMTHLREESCAKMILLEQDEFKLDRYQQNGTQQCASPTTRNIWMTNNKVKRERR